MKQTLNKTLALLTLGSAAAFGQMTVTINTGNPTPTVGGAAFAYTIVASNGGAFPVYFQLVDPLPPGIIFQNVSVVGANGGTAACVGPTVATNGPVTCSTPSFPAGGQVTITIVAQVIDNVASGIRTNTVSVFPPGSPSTASVQQNLQVDAPLSISTTATAQTVLGGLIGYNITVLNGGSSDAINATFTDTLPPSTAFEGLYGTGAFADTCAYRPATHTVVCPSIDVPSGSHELTVVVRAATEQSSPNSVTNQVAINTAGTGNIVIGAAQASTTVVH